MGLTPSNHKDVTYKTQKNISRTYGFNFKTGEFTQQMMDGEDSLKQFIEKAIRTARYRFLIYSREYGSELQTLIGQDVTSEFLQVEVPRLVRETLIYDDRVKDVRDIAMYKQGDILSVSFTVEMTDGFSFEQEVEL